MRDFRVQKEKLIFNIFNEIGLNDERLMTAMMCVDRHLFLPEAQWDKAYENIALPVGFEQKTCKPSLLAEMISLLELSGIENILEIGTGSGYLTAILSKLSSSVHTIEIIKHLYFRARTLLNFKLALNNVKCHHANGSNGFIEEAPFDRIILTCAVFGGIPSAIIEQLAVGGIMVFPMFVNNNEQLLIKLCKSDKNDFHIEKLYRVNFDKLITEDNNDVYTSMA